MVIDGREGNMLVFDYSQHCRPVDDDEDALVRRIWELYKMEGELMRYVNSRGALKESSGPRAQGRASWTLPQESLFSVG